MARLKRLEGINPWLGSAWWLPSCIGKMQSPWPLLRGTCSNQEPLVLSNSESTEEANCEDLEKVTVGDDSDKFFQVGSQLPP